MQTKETKKEPRFEGLTSQEVYSVFLAICTEKGITFQNLMIKTNKDKSNLSLQLKALEQIGLLIKEGAGKRNHPQILKISEKKLKNFFEQNSPSIKKLWETKSEKIKELDYSTFLTWHIFSIPRCKTFEELFRQEDLEDANPIKYHLF